MSVHLRNKFYFWNVHGIMNTSGLLQVNESQDQKLNFVFNM